MALIDWTIENHGEPSPVRPLQDNLYFATEDLDATMDRAVGVGAEITAPIEVMPWGERSFSCTDPDGHPLCFVDQQTLFFGRGAPGRKTTPSRAPSETNRLDIGRVGWPSIAT